MTILIVTALATATLLVLAATKMADDKATVCGIKNRNAKAEKEATIGNMMLVYRYTKKEAVAEYDRQKNRR